MTEFDNGYSEFAKQRHQERVAQNPERIRYAIQLFKQHGIRYELKDEERGHFHVWRQRDGKLFNFYAGTGKIAGYDRARGIHTLVKMMIPKTKRTVCLKDVPCPDFRRKGAALCSKEAAP